MQQVETTIPLSPAIGQYYGVSSVDLGFVNVTPTTLLVEIKYIDRKKNELELAVHPASEWEITKTFVAFARWFDEVYPRCTPANCLLKNLAAFERLIDDGLARLRS